MGGSTVTVKDWVTHIIAIIIIVPFIVLIFKHLWSFDEGGVEAGEAVLKLLGSIVTLVLGYYFGSAAGEKQAEASRKEALQVKETTITDVDKIKEKFDSLSVEYKKRLEEIKNLKENLRSIIEEE